MEHLEPDGVVKQATFCDSVVKPGRCDAFLKLPCSLVVESVKRHGMSLADGLRRYDGYVTKGEDYVRAVMGVTESYLCLPLTMDNNVMQASHARCFFKGT